MIDYDYRLDYITGSFDALMFASFHTKPFERVDAELELEESKPVEKDGFFIGEVQQLYTMHFVNDKTGEQVVLEEKFIRKFCDEHKLLGVVKTDKYYFYVVPKVVVQLYNLLDFKQLYKGASSFETEPKMTYCSNFPYAQLAKYLDKGNDADCICIFGECVSIFDRINNKVYEYSISSLSKFNALITKYKVLKN